MSSAAKKEVRAKSTKPAQKFHFFRMIRRVAPMIYRVFPVSFIFFCLLGALHGVSWAFSVWTNQRLYDALSNAVFSHGPVPAVYWAAAVTCLVVVAQQTLNGVHNFLWEVFADKAQGKLALGIHDKAAKLPAQLFEDKNKLDDINKANEGKDCAVWMFFSFIGIFFFYLPYFGFLFFYLYRVKPLLAVSLVIVFAPSLLSQIVRAKIYAALENESAPIRRQNEHYEKCLCSRETLKETRLLGGFKFFRKLFMDTIELLSQKEWNAEKKNGLINLGLNSFKLLGWLGVLYLLFTSLMAGDVTIGAFASVLSSLGLMFGIMEEVMRNSEFNITKNLGKVQNFLNFLDLPLPEGGDARPDFGKGIVLRDVTFTYPLAEKPSLNGVSLEIKPGETLALVGENGSGKTTLVKILTGLYKPETGEATIAGLDVKDASEKALFSQTSGVFQNYMTYALTLSENARISDFSSGEAPETVLESAGVDFTNAETYPNGLESILSREFDGVDLSGGQWQRLAIARGLYRRHDFIVLDEPTAAIDPIEETKVYYMFAELARGATSVIVTHRLGSARIADRIAVMDKGRIVESGTHETLLKRGGKYARMWAAQARYYR
ncbi:MAG: ABC transporter ATP-binding protein/permease [Defluviitaleaceae bacterium]|nr:ABC transporter ATP-binding protein/permease [Defluviitaleaceae bacterium]